MKIDGRRIARPAALAAGVLAGFAGGAALARIGRRDRPEDGRPPTPHAEAATGHAAAEATPGRTAAQAAADTQAATDAEAAHTRAAAEAQAAPGVGTATGEDVRSGTRAGDSATAAAAALVAAAAATKTMPADAGAPVRLVSTTRSAPVTPATARHARALRPAAPLSNQPPDPPSPQPGDQSIPSPDQSAMDPTRATDDPSQARSNEARSNRAPSNPAAGDPATNDQATNGQTTNGQTTNDQARAENPAPANPDQAANNPDATANNPDRPTPGGPTNGSARAKRPKPLHRATSARRAAAIAFAASPEPTPAEARPGWLDILRNAARRTGEHNLTTWAAALTYYAVLSLFPALLVAVAVLRLAGHHATQKILGTVTDLAPGPARTILTTAITDLEKGQSATAGLLAFVGILTALWSATGYVGAFMQATNAINEVSGKRPLWRTLPARIGVTIACGIIVGAAALAAVLTGGVARWLGGLIGVGGGAVRIWDIVKWPVIAIAVGLLFALLYWASPASRRGGFRPITPGSILAVVAWLAASGGFVVYVSHFGSYNKTYGSLAAVIVFLIWLWISNLAILFGAEFDAETRRGRDGQSVNRGARRSANATTPSATSADPSSAT